MITHRFWTGTLVLSFLGLVLPALSQSVPEPTWTWVKGSSLGWQPGLYGVIGVEVPQNSPGGRDSSTGARDAEGRLLLFGGWGNDSDGLTGTLNDLWRYDPSTGNWTWIKGASRRNRSGTYGTLGLELPENTPGSRYLGASWADSSGAFWIFGGVRPNPRSLLPFRYNDLWKFDPSTGNWTWMKGQDEANQQGVYGSRGVADPANEPGARERLVSWTDSSGRLWLFGGLGYDAHGAIGMLNDLWRYDPATGDWTWVAGSSTSSTSGTQTGAYGTRGVPGPTNTPGPRQRATSWTDASGKLWLFGGYGFDAHGTAGSLNDLWRFDSDEGVWTWMAGSDSANPLASYGTRGVASPANVPGPRFGSTAWAAQDGAFWILGGYGIDSTDSTGNLGDLWKYDPATQNWTWMKGPQVINQLGTYGTRGEPDPENNPGTRVEMVSWVGATGDLWLFGGNGHSSNEAGTLLNDLWKLEPDALPGRAQGDFNEDGCVDFQDFLFLLEHWGEMLGSTPVGFADFLALLDNWGIGC